MENCGLQRVLLFFVLTLCLNDMSFASGMEDARKRGYATEIDFTDETKYSLDAMGSVKKLRTFPKDYKHDSYITGRYTEPLSYTGGSTIEIFPNGKFVVSEWCDICGLPGTDYVGSWHEDGNVISFLVEQQKPGPHAEDWRHSFERRFGRFGKFEFFVAANGLKIGDSILVPQDAITQAPIDRYFVRTTPYYDWVSSYSQALKDVATPPSQPKKN